MVEQTNSHYQIVKRKKNLDVKRRQSAPKIFELNASIYIWKREQLLKANNLFVKGNSTYIMPYERSIDIDNKFDFKIVQKLLKKIK